MNSCLYRCEVNHHRLWPREHKFSYDVFMFYIDLDELEMLNRTLRLLSFNKFNAFSFRNKDHMSYPAGAAEEKKSLKQNVLDYLASTGISLKNGKIMLLTNLATFGYSFNPISFYICFDEHEKPVCAVAEVCNTHGEMKLYLLGNESFDGESFQKMVAKLFYVSPFAKLDSSFDFIFKIPADTLLMRVDDYEQGKRFLLSSLSGKRKNLTDANLLMYSIRFPMISLKIMTLIFWQAFKLYLKRIPFNAKNFNPHLQQDMVQYKKSKA